MYDTGNIENPRIRAQFTQYTDALAHKSVPPGRGSARPAPYPPSATLPCSSDLTSNMPCTLPGRKHASTAACPHSRQKWLVFFASLVDLIAIPTLCSASDAVGRRAVLGGAFALGAASALALGLAPNSIVAVAAVQIVSSVAGAALPVGQAIIIDIS